MGCWDTEEKPQERQRLQRHARKFGGCGHRHPKGQCTSESSSTRQSCTAAGNPSPERLLVFVCISLRRQRGREEGKGRSRMPELCNSSVGGRIARDRGVTDCPLSSGTFLPMNPTAASHGVAFAELLHPQAAAACSSPLLRVPRAEQGGERDLSVLEG